MNLLDPIPFAVWSLSLYACLIWLVLAVKERTALRRRVGLWLSMRIHALRDRLEQLEDLVDDVLVRA